MPDDTEILEQAGDAGRIEPVDLPGVAEFPLTLDLRLG